MRSTPAIFLDKDGTLLADVPYNVQPELMRWAPGAGAGIRRLGRLGLPLIVISNQSGVGLGYFPSRALAPVEAELRRMFAACGAVLTSFYFCPHLPSAHCPCRKPGPGLLMRAADEHGIDLARSWMVGDILDDVEAGRRAGCRTVLLDNGNETEWLASPWRAPHHRVPSLEEASVLIASSLPAAGRARQFRTVGA